MHSQVSWKFGTVKRSAKDFGPPKVVLRLRGSVLALTVMTAATMTAKKQVKQTASERDPRWAATASGFDFRVWGV